MSTYRLIPALKDYIWGGNDLKDYGKISSKDRIAESWELSFHQDGLTSVIKNGKKAFLKDVVTREELGSLVSSFDTFPVLIKLINSASNLSVQVHPDDNYALKYENSLGKIEMWYVLDCKDDSYLYIGFKKDESKQSVEEMLKDDSILDHLNKYKVKRGDCFLIPPKVAHCIGKGITLIEIQSSSNITYRLYDYNRIDKDGKKRELHIQKGMDCLSLKRYERRDVDLPLLFKTKYFATYVIDSSSGKIKSDDTSFVSITIIEGEGEVDDMICKKGDSFFITASSDVKLAGDFKAIMTRIEKEDD